MKKISNRASSIVGTGLVALDVILNGTPTTPAKLCAGGSCGNVLSILAFLGWKSKPIARLSDNGATEKLFNDFRKFKVDTSLISTTNDGKTPIIIHRILKDKDGRPQHKFEFKIPNTNIWLPAYKPVLASNVDELLTKQPLANIFYFDRISRSTINLASYYKENGAIIIFEPSSLKDDKQTLECLALADIIKFSHERISNYSQIFPEPNGFLEIETLGKDGLHYRLKSSENQNWKKIPPFKFDQIIDSAGAGDWCTAGIINELGFNGITSLRESTEKDIVRALTIGQALGGINCRYDGARGIMYNLSYSSLIENVEAIVNNKSEVVTEISNDVEIITIKDFDFNSLL